MIDTFTQKYLRAALWAETVILPCREDELVDGYMDVPDDHCLHGIGEFEPLDDCFDVSDFDEASILKAITDCAKFRDLMEQAGLMDDALDYTNEDHVAQDFWLTRNGHGAGFWDGDYGYWVGDKITALVESHFSEQNILVNLDGSLTLG